MAEIINEIPEELEMEGEEVEVKASESEKVASEEKTGDVEVAEKAPKKEAKPEQLELDFDIEIEDDTPKADRNRDPLPENIKEELEADTLDEYSDRVKNRMAQLKKAWHDERRAKEASERQRQEAERVATLSVQENQKLKETLSSGEEDYIKTLQDKYTADLAFAQREYKEAYDAGCAPKIIAEATSNLTTKYVDKAILLEYCV